MKDLIALLQDKPAWLIILVALILGLAFAARHLNAIVRLITMKKTRELSAKVEMTASIQWLGQHLDNHVGVVEVDVVNKGAVRLYIEDLLFSLRTLCEDSPLTTADPNKHPKLMNQLFFPEVEMNDEHLFPKEWKYAWVDPGCQDTYRYPINVPREAKFAMLRIKLYYPDDLDDFQHEQYFCALPQWETKASISLTSLDQRAG